MNKTKKNKAFVLVVNMGNYFVDEGGTNKTVYEQNKMFNKQDIDFVCIYPFYKVENLFTISPCGVAQASNSSLWGVMHNRRHKGVKTTGEILKYIKELSGKIEFKGVLIHHLIGVNLCELNKLLSCLKTKIAMYIHDYYTICPSNYMMTTDDEFCGSCYLGDDKCKNCPIYPSSATRAKEIKKFFKENHVGYIISPSEYCLDIWCKAFGEIETERKVISHQIYCGEYKKNRELIDGERKIRVGYVGAANKVKGWPYWNKLLEQVDKDQYEFHVFSQAKNTPPNVINHVVRFQKGNNAMIDALRENEIDVVVLYSLSRETYSFTYNETVASNAYIVTNQYSGNIAKQVKENRNGIVLENPDALVDFFADTNRVREEINRYRSACACGPLELVMNTEIVDVFTDDHVGIILDGDYQEKKNVRIRFKKLGCLYQVLLRKVKLMVKRMIRR